MSWPLFHPTLFFVSESFIYVTNVIHIFCHCTLYHLGWLRNKKTEQTKINRCYVWQVHGMDAHETDSVPSDTIIHIYAWESVRKTWVYHQIILIDQVYYYGWLILQDIQSIQTLSSWNISTIKTGNSAKEFWDIFPKNFLDAKWIYKMVLRLLLKMKFHHYSAGTILTPSPWKYGNIQR